MKVTIVKNGKAKKISSVKFLKTKSIFKAENIEVALDDVIEVVLSKDEYLKLNKTKTTNKEE